MALYPSQATTRAQKHTFQFTKENSDYWISQAAFGGNQYAELYLLYKAIEGELNTTDYSYVLNPFNVDEDKLKNFPSRIRNYDIISPIFQARLGEMLKRYHNYEVITTNADVKNKYTEALNDQMYGTLAKIAVNELNKNGINTGVDTQETKSPQQVAAEHKDSYNDTRAMQGQEALDFIKYDQRLQELYQEVLKDWLTTGRCFTYKEVYRGQVNMYTVPALEAWASLGHSDYVEDGNAFVWRRPMNINDVIDRYRDRMADQDVYWLEEQVRQMGTSGGSGSGNNAPFVYLGSENMDSIRYNFGYFNGGKIFVYIVQNKTLVKRGIVTYKDELGQISEKEVEDDYIFDEKAGDIDINWEWENETWEYVRLGEENGGIEGKGIYLYGEPVNLQRTQLNNDSRCKLTFNGRVQRTKTGKILSHVKKGLVYQILYNIYQYQREMIINRNKDKIMLMPMGLFPKSFGKDPFTSFMYFLQATGLALFDETKPNAAAIINSLKSIDMGLGNYIAEMNKIIDNVKNEYWDAVGFNRQRYGDTNSSDGKGVNEQAIFRSSLITAQEDFEFERFVETEYAGALDASKLAWIDGKQGMYLNSDGRRAFLDINGIEHLESNYAVFVKDSQEQYEKLKALRALAQPMAQKGTAKSHVLAEIIENNNFSKIKSIMSKADEAADAYAAQLQKSQQDSQERITQMVEAGKDKDRASNEKIAADQNTSKEKIAVLNASAAVLGYDQGENGENDLQVIEDINFELQKHRDTVALKKRDLDIKEKKINTDNKNKKVDQELKDKQIKVQAKKKATATT